MIDRFPRYVIALAVVFYLVLVVPLSLWPMATNMLSSLWFCLYSFLACALSLELTELVLSLVWKSKVVPISHHELDRRYTAIVMTICDDVDPYALKELVPLSHSGYDVFLLDDSTFPVSIPPNVAPFITHIRRQNRKGAKAGSLNNWLSIHGDGFSNIVLLDADSTISPEAVDRLAAAVHPANSDIAVFQAKTLPRTTDCSTVLSLALGIGARPCIRVLERVHAHLGILLSFGHNQLVRISALRLVGGFSETFTSEDTALSMSLSSHGLLTKLVDAWSYDTEPSSLPAYVRRTVRWARQTLELFWGNWGDCPLRMKLLLCRHLLAYFLPIIGFILLILSLSYAPPYAMDVLLFSCNSFLLKDGYTVYGIAMWTTTLLVLLRFALQWYIALAEGVPTHHLLLSALVAPSLQTVLIIPVAFGLTLSMIGRRVRFRPTNAQRELSCGLLAFFRAHVSISVTGLAGLALMLVLIHKPGAALVGFNFLWVSGIVLSPLVVSVLGFKTSRFKGVSCVFRGQRW